MVFLVFWAPRTNGYIKFVNNIRRRNKFLQNVCRDCTQLNKSRSCEVFQNDMHLLQKSLQKFRYGHINACLNPKNSPNNSLLMKTLHQKKRRTVFDFASLKTELQDSLLPNKKVLYYNSILYILV